MTEIFCHMDRASSEDEDLPHLWRCKSRLSGELRTSSLDHRIDEVGGLGKVRVDRVVLEIDGGHAEESINRYSKINQSSIVYSFIA